MRELKFRAYGSFGSDPKDHMVYDWQDTVDAGEYLGFNGGGFFEIMQYTGLKDSVGKEIYEGDVIKVKNVKNLMFVGWGKSPIYETYGFQLFRIINGKRIEKTACTSWSREKRVIGNIHENPELLK